MYVVPKLNVPDARRLMQSISYTKQYDLDTGEMSYREIRQRSVAQEDDTLRLNLN